MIKKFNENYIYQPKKKLNISDIVNGISNANPAILSQAITLLESKRKEDKALVYASLSKLPPSDHKSFRIGITGSPGVGKSTFIETFGKYLSTMGISVAVLTIDPSSKINGGSILGDKTRMEELSKDSNVFIRPSPSKGELGGVGEQSYESILLCEKAGFDVILIETVGVGQSETHVKHVVDFFLLLILNSLLNSPIISKKAYFHLIQHTVHTQIKLLHDDLHCVISAGFFSFFDREKHSYR